MRKAPEIWILILFIITFFSCKEQNGLEIQIDSISPNHQKKSEISDTVLLNATSIYEFGQPVNNFENNFINLFNNWTTENIDNAKDYKLINFSLVETISDSEVYRRYRNFFIGNKPIVSRIKSGSKSGSNGNKESHLFVYPVKRYQFLYDNTDSLYTSPDWMDKGFKKEALKILKEDLNIDTLNVFHHRFKENKLISSNEVHSFLSYSILIDRSENLSQSIVKFSVDSLSQNYIDVALKRIKNYDQLSTLEKKRLAIEELVINKITNQINFTKTIEIGDVIYLINMKYKDQNYQLYVILDRARKQVIWDDFFNPIKI